MKNIVRIGLMMILACLILSGCVGEVETTEVATKKTMTSERTDELLDDKIGEFENGKKSGIYCDNRRHE